MAVLGSYSRFNFLSELADPLDTQEGVLSPAEQRLRVVQNMLGDTDIALSDLLATDVATAGDVENSKFIKAGASAEATAIVDFSNLTLADGARLIRGVNDFEAVTGWMAFSGNTENDAFRYSAYFQPQTSSSGKLLGIGNTAILQSGTSVNLAEAAQLHIIVNSGATITSRGGDATAGLHPVWAKVQGDVGATWNSGMRVAPIWSDIQINGVDVSGEEVYNFFGSNGGSLANALLRLEGGADNFLSTDHGAGTGFVADATGETLTPVVKLQIDINGTPYVIHAGTSA